jgi:hypothetical protein
VNTNVFAGYVFVNASLRSRSGFEKNLNGRYARERLAWLLVRLLRLTMWRAPDSLLDESPPPIPTTEGLADEMFTDSEAEARAAMNSQAELVDSDVESDGEDEDIAPSSRRKGGAESHRNDDDDDMDQAAEDEGLFGSDDDGDRDDTGETPP